MPTAAVARRVMRAVPPLRRVTDTASAQHVVQTARAIRAVRPAGRFMAGQVARPTGVYELRAGGGAVHVRHRSRDVAILAEIFTVGSYTPPADVDLAGPLRVMDLGGNIGLFGAYALARWDVSWLMSYEPDPENARLLRATASPHPQWHTLEVAAGNADGVIKFVAGSYSESRAAGKGEDGIPVPLVDVFKAPPCDLLKMDIEGGEWPILEDPRLGDIARVMVLEWHTRGCAAADARAYASSMLRAAGYVNQSHEPGRFASNGLMWAWKG